MKTPEVIIYCEQSGAVREALRGLGIDAWSNDILPAADKSEFHFQDDARNILLRYPLVPFIAHPECRYLSVSGMHWNSRDWTRKVHTQQALDFAGHFFHSDAPIKIIENPVSILSTHFGKADQYVQPYELGDDASKKTCFWIKGTNERITVDPVKRFPGRMVWDEVRYKYIERWSNQTDSGQNRLAPSETRSADRAKTYPGIANGLADLMKRALNGA
jgi:hypothetical protein